MIPARMGSSRFPGKPLAPLLGMALVLHVWHRCRLFEGFSDVIVTTCDTEIQTACEQAGARVIMTSDQHPGCVDRVEEAIGYLNPEPAGDDLVLMVQGDEVLVTPEMVGAVVRDHTATKAPVVNLATPLFKPADQDDPNAVKVASATDGRALYFSRSPIPSRHRNPDVPVYQQTGVIGFSASFLRTFGTLDRTPLEISEGVDLLRALEHGYDVRIVHGDRETIGVDTPDDLARAEKILARDATTARYLNP